MEKIFSGKTLEEAKAEAAEYFSAKGADSGDIKIEIVEQPVKKLFGTKGEYKIRASYENGADMSADDIINDIINSPVGKPEEPESDPDKYAKLTGYISAILKGLGADDFKFDINEKEDAVVLNIIGDNLGIVIGRRGETLDSLQYLAVLANGRTHNSPRISIDCNGYREKRRETLESLARRTSAKVKKQGRRITLEPMNPYERRIIHSTVSEIDGVYSNSIGDEPYRKVVISATLPKHRSNSPDKGGMRRDRNSDALPTGRSYKQSSGFSTSFEREYKRNTDIEISQDTVDVEKSTSLYGKIEL